MGERIAITGLGMLSPRGVGIEANFSNENREMKFTEKNMPLFEGFSIKDYSKKISVVRKERISQITVAAAVMAYEDSGLANSEVGINRVGAIMSTEYGPTNSVLKYLNMLYDRGPGDVSPNLFTQTVYNVSLGQASIQLGIKGVSSTLVGCSAVGYALDLLKDDKADAVMAIGGDELNLITDSHYLERKEPNYKMGEGCAAIVLEKETFARKRNARIYGYIEDYVKLSAYSQYKEYYEFKKDDEALPVMYEKILSANRLTINDINTCYLFDNGLRNIEGAEDKVLDSLNYKGRRVKPRSIYGEAFGANEEFAIIDALMTGEGKEKMLVSSLFLNGNVDICLIERE